MTPLERRARDLLSDLKLGTGAANEERECVQRHLAAAMKEAVDHSCTTCGGSPPPSEKPCVCGGTGKMVDEIQGLREEYFRLDASIDGIRKEAEKEISALRSRVAELEAKLKVAVDAVNAIRQFAVTVHLEQWKLVKAALAKIKEAP